MHWGDVAVSRHDSLPLIHPADAAERRLVPVSTVARRLGCDATTVRRRIGTDDFPDPVARLNCSGIKGRPMLLFPSALITRYVEMSSASTGSPTSIERA